MPSTRDHVPGGRTVVKFLKRLLTESRGGSGRKTSVYLNDEESSMSGNSPSMNLLQNGAFQDGTAGWFGHAGCESIHAFPASTSGSPHGPPASSPASHLPPSCASIPAPLAGPTAPYIIASNRHEYWQGPCQMLPAVEPLVTYAVTAWVRVGSSSHPLPLNAKVEMVLAVDTWWLPVAAIEAKSATWMRCAGAFQLDKKPQSLKFYFQGPPAGIDIWVADVRVSPQDTDAVITHLKEMAEKVRKRDIIIKVTSSSGAPLSHARVTLTHEVSSFAIGSCMNQGGFKDPRYRQFFADHFSFAVFENELKWAQMESARSRPEYRPADDMLQWLEERGIPVRGHCIFWDNEVPSWLPGLSDDDMAEAVDKRVVDLLSRYKGRFAHYDVNNEMLHGGFFANRLGPGIITRMFQLARRTDPSALLFVNDYSVEDGKDAKSSPQKYLESVQDLLKSGAPIDGIGMQAHATSPIPSHIYEAFETLAGAGLPIWLTELDVESENERVRADDLEMMLRVAFAHPSVEGVVLWGFWQGVNKGGMYRKNSHLVNEDWSIAEAGKRLEEVVKEWSNGTVCGTITRGGTFSSRVYLGRYKILVEVDGLQKEETIVIDRGEDPKVVDLVMGSVMADDYTNVVQQGIASNFFGIAKK